jgi:hypothetical protein
MAKRPTDRTSELLGVYVPDPRLAALHERLSQYYRDTPDSMSNRVAMPYYREFKDWCRDCGYTLQEVNYAKRNYGN